MICIADLFCNLSDRQMIKIDHVSFSYGEGDETTGGVREIELRNTLAFWKKQGKTIVISEHRLYYLRGVADRFIYVKDGHICQEYSAAEFEQLSEPERETMGLRTFALENLQPPVPSRIPKETMELRQFHFAYKNATETLHLQDCEIPSGRHDLELILDCCTDILHLENGAVAEQYPVDEKGLEKIRWYLFYSHCKSK